MLRPRGFVLFTMYDEFGDAESKIADPVMIHDCGVKNRVLLTGDQQLVRSWAKEIAESKIAVFVVTDNHEGPKKWGPRIIAAKREIMRELQRRQKPFTARISTEGHVTQVRLYEGGQWKAIAISKKNPPHESKYPKKTEPGSDWMARSRFRMRFGNLASHLIMLASRAEGQGAGRVGSGLKTKHIRAY